MTSGTEQSKMLSGVVVLELGQVIAGNYGGVLLADMGAEVIKIEPLTGDTARNAQIAPLDGESAIHLCMNRGKKSVSLDLKSPEGKETFYRLVEQADVVLDNFRPGVMQRLGIDHASLEVRRPGIITVSVTGFGESGPSMLRPAFDLVIQAYSGHMHITGEPDRPPSRVGIPIADISGGIFACMSVLAALAARGIHGQGTHADVSMLDSLVSMLSYDAVEFLNTGKDVSRMGTAHSHMVPWQAFAVLDGFIVVSAREDKFWLRLCDALERPDLKQHAYTVDNATRVANRDWLVAELEATFSTKAKDHWVEILDRHDIPSAPVNDFQHVFADPQVVSRGLVKEYNHATIGPVKYVGSPVLFSGWTPPNRAAPMLGQDTRDVLAERLGLTDAEIDHLVTDLKAREWPDPAESSDLRPSS